MRSGTGAKRADRPNLFYPLYISEDGTKIIEFGSPISYDVDRNTIPAVPGTRTVWPIRSNGEEGRWRIGRETLIDYYEKGYVRLGSFTNNGMALTYLAVGEQQKIENGTFEVVGHREDGSIIESEMTTDRLFYLVHNGIYRHTTQLIKVLSS